MTRLDHNTVHELFKLTIVGYYADYEIAEDDTLPLEFESEWTDSAAAAVLTNIERIGIDLPTDIALAKIALTVSADLHSRLCKTNRRACPTDTNAISFLLEVIAYIHLRYVFTPALIGHASPYLESDTMEHEDAEAGLASVIQMLLHPSDMSFVEPPTVSSTPVIQLNTPISSVTEQQYLNYRSLTSQIRDAIQQGPWECEVTSDFASPSTRHRPVSEAAVRARLFRTSCVIIFSEHAGDGTFITWTIADELMIPCIVLRRSGDLKTPARYPGEFRTRYIYSYDTPDEAVQIIGDFIRDNEARIRERARTVFEYSQMPIDHIIDRMNTIDPSAFDASPVTRERARFYTASPVHWFQALKPVAVEILRILGVTEPLPAPPPIPSSDAERPETSDNSDLISFRAMDALHRFGEFEGLDYEQLDRLVAAWRSPALRVAVSPRQTSPTYETWRDLWRLVGD